MSCRLSPLFEVSGLGSHKRRDQTVCEETGHARKGREGKGRDRKMGVALHLRLRGMMSLQLIVKIGTNMIWGKGYGLMH